MEPKPRIFLISKAGYRHNILMAMLNSNLREKEIACATSFTEGGRINSPEYKTVVIIDHTLPKDEIEQGIRDIRGSSPKVKILQLTALPKAPQNGDHGGPDIILNDGFSTEDFITQIERLLN